MVRFVEYKQVRENVPLILKYPQNASNQLERKADRKRVCRSHPSSANQAGGTEELKAPREAFMHI